MMPRLENHMPTESDPILNPLALTGAQRRVLRGLGHSLKPIVRIGRQGLSDGVIGATTTALKDHELIKISVGPDCPLPRKEAPHALGGRTGSHVAQIIGRTALLYRRRFKEPEIKLPGAITEAAPDDPVHNT